MAAAETCCLPRAPRLLGHQDDQRQPVLQVPLIQRLVLGCVRPLPSQALGNMPPLVLVTQGCVSGSQLLRKVTQTDLGSHHTLARTPTHPTHWHTPRRVTHTPSPCHHRLRWPAPAPCFAGPPQPAVHDSIPHMKSLSACACPSLFPESWTSGVGGSRVGVRLRRSASQRLRESQSAQRRSPGLVPGPAPGQTGPR